MLWKELIELLQQKVSTGLLQFVRKIERIRQNSQQRVHVCLLFDLRIAPTQISRFVRNKAMMEALKNCISVESTL